MFKFLGISSVKEKIQAHVSKLTHQETGVRRAAAGALWSLAVNADNQITMAHAGAIAPLVRLLSDSDTVVRQNAAGALANLALNSEIALLIEQEKQSQLRAAAQAREVGVGSAARGSAADFTLKPETKNAQILPDPPPVKAIVPPPAAIQAVSPAMATSEASEEDSFKIGDEAEAPINPEAISTLSGHTSWVTALTSLSNGPLASGSVDNTIKVLDVGLRPVLAVEQTTASPSAASQPTSPSSSSAAREAVPVFSSPSTLKSATVPSPSKQPVAVPAPVSRAEFDLLMTRVQTDARLEVSLVSLEETLFELQQRMSNTQKQIAATFSLKEKEVLQARIAVDQATAHLIIERRTIHSNAAHEVYYLAIQTYVSALMVASLGIGSGYVAVNNSQAAKVVGWICNAISSAFPGASLVTTAVSAGVNYLDVTVRKAFLSKIRVFGTTITEAEILGEQVARLLVRAHVHEKTALSQKHADKDAQALIRVIVNANPPLSRDEHAAENIFKAIWENAIYCIDPLPEATPTNFFQVTTTKTFLTASSSTAPLTPNLNSRTKSAAIESSADQVEQLMRQLEEERETRKRLEEKQKEHEADLAQLKIQMQSTARKADVASKKDLAVTQAEIAQLKSGKSGSGQMLMTRTQETNGAQTMEEQFIALQQDFARMQEHVHHVTQQTLTHQEKFEDLERTPPSPGSQASLLSRHGILPPPIPTSGSAVNNASFSSEKDERDSKAKRTLFGK